DVGRAARRVDDPVEIDERIVARCVLVVWLRELGVVLLVEGGMATRCGIGRRVAHILHVTLPTEPALLELRRHGRYVGGVDATRPQPFTLVCRCHRGYVGS